jgi:hypothetical protein
VFSNKRLLQINVSYQYWELIQVEVCEPVAYTKFWTHSCQVGWNYDYHSEKHFFGVPCS